MRIDLRAGAPVVKMLVCSAIVEDVWKEAENGVNFVFLVQRKAREEAATGKRDLRKTANAGDIPVSKLRYREIVRFE